MSRPVVLKEDIYTIIMMIDIDTLLAWGATYKKVDAHEIIFREGNHASFYQQLVSGKIKWFNISDDGKEFIQDIVHPGECFGELPLFDGEPYAATAVAEENSVIIRLHKATFHQLIAENTQIHLAFSKLLSQRLRFKFLFLKEIACHTPEHKISSLFTHLRQTKKNICPKCNQVKLTRQQIADMTGLRVETVIRSIKQLQKKGEVLIEHGKVYC
jgi:CRP-like cAMP-binding protein